MDATPRRPSMADVAARAEVSYQTVSRVLNEPQVVRPATRERVLEAISALGYTRNRAARALKTTRSSLIGMLTDGSSLFGPAETTTAIEAAAREAGYSVLLTTVGAHEDGAREIGSELLGSGADGILVVAAHEGMVPAVATAARSTPVVAVSAQAPKVDGVEVVGVEQQLGARLVVEHLARTGARSAVHLCGPQDWFDARARLDGFQRAAQELGLEASVIGPGDWNPRSGYELTSSLIAEGALPDAIFAANDMMAIGVLHALHLRGLRVPEDVAVVGFDNTVGAEFLIPSLTTVSQPFAELGRLALERLLCLLEGREVPVNTPRTLPPRLVARRSTHPERTH
ncbi:LacI family DNA-binding transcriptional regulator [Brachybacterium fresconis]|uniref:DNA-binding LacI/PurR family transcriptional regulator n=1 Tax=Brachybacterium fresconis TaxID=173363 RepID=A0ABS4YK96_9MICO|nr:LacI family DNA-binding transcriptional regulator [Brachybacterium fresconis]MBP2409208.1 DNA-binding LacI/PurR family transcriptional regulator [Brachybacterium fresconis]